MGAVRLAIEPLQNTEVWRPAPGFENYEVSTHGRVRREAASRGRAAGYLLKLVVSENGYHRVGLWRSGKLTYAAVHRLVMLAFVGPPPHPDDHAAHWDGCRTNNRLGNLRWATIHENSEDKVRLGTLALGENHGLSKLTDAQVVEIRTRRAAGDRVVDLAASFGVSRVHIGRVVSGECRARKTNAKV